MMPTHAPRPKWPETIAAAAVIDTTTAAANGLIRARIVNQLTRVFFFSLSRT